MSRTFLEHVFVYGTLKQGYGNNRLLSSSEYLGTFETEELFLLGDVGFPYAFTREVFKKDAEVTDYFKPVLGEVYQVTDPKVMEHLDLLEGYGEGDDFNHYERRRAPIKELDIEPWMYVQPNPYFLNRIKLCQEYEGVWTWERNTTHEK